MQNALSMACQTCDPCMTGVVSQPAHKLSLFYLAAYLADSALYLLGFYHLFILI